MAEPAPSALGNGLLPNGRAGLGWERCALSYPQFGESEAEISEGEAAWAEMT